MIVGNIEAGKTVSTQAAQASGNAAKGEAVAIALFNVVKAQGNDLARYLGSIADLDTEGRKAFRSWLESKRREMRATVRTMDGSPYAHVANRAGASAFVRISEAITFSKACDVGYVFNPDEGYHWNVAQARVLMAAKAAPGPLGDVSGTEAEAVGPSVRRGRPPLTKVQKAVAYLDKLGLSDKERATLAAALG